MSSLTAIWHLSLDCECPSCKEDVDLIDADDFWSGREIQACENRTPSTTDMEVCCPRCGHEFTVTTEY